MLAAFSGVNGYSKMAPRRAGLLTGLTRSRRLVFGLLSLVLLVVLGAFTLVGLWPHDAIVNDNGSLSDRHQGLSSLCMSPDSKWLASGASDGTLRIWSIERRCTVN